MLLRSVRGMQTKHVWFAGVACLLFIFYVIFHLEREIQRLDEARIRLEAVADFQSGNSKLAQRRLPSSYSGNKEDYHENPSSSPEFDHDIIIYNRVPKTGSTSFAGIAYDLCTQNKYSVLHFNITKNMHTLSLSDQMRFVRNITKWKAKQPAMYHGHLAYLEFTRFGAIQKPLYINLIRDPLERLVSYFYFVRHGDDFRPHIKRRKSGNKQTFDECVMNDGTDCEPENLWMQIPFFCGHAAECWVPGNRWALDQAKYNLVNNYLVVGITEELGDFVAVLEVTLPRFFKGATELYNTGRKSHLRKTFNKQPPSPSALSKIRESDIWKMENEFYEFAKDHFHFIKRRTFTAKHGVLMEKGLQFNYEKIRPR
ncbi:heparan sulfate 2-O-sulfotransferase 1-like isoform X2 [Tubulanus polymorphus]|uniref:heparan sulfate 2-O-sulfotransferase 1-like isoform X2 n=1 Tax=Tubulanus polymorphus TaxID=672921 RepID=UPI003DA31AD1